MLSELGRKLAEIIYKDRHYVAKRLMAEASGKTGKKREGYSNVIFQAIRAKQRAVNAAGVLIDNKIPALDFEKPKKSVGK